MAIAYPDRKTSVFRGVFEGRIAYKSAGENIAAHSTVQAAFDAWMNSSGHRANILNSSFNYTGIGVVSSPKYGKMLVQMFVGR